MSNPLHRRPYRVYAALFLMLLPAFASAQRLGYLQHQSWSTDSGLPQSSVHQILQSHDGYLWLATEGGVVRYDGVVFKTYSHVNDPSFTSDDVSSIAEDRDGNLWFGTADGVVERSHGRMRRFGEAEGLPSASVTALSIAKAGTVIAVTTLGAASFDGSRFQPVDATAAELDTSRGSANRADGTAWSWDQRSVTTQRASTILTWRTGAELPGSRVQSVLIDRSGIAWVGTNRGLVTLSATDRRVQPVTALGVESVLALTEDAEGDLWIGTETSGLHALRTRTFRTEPLLASDEICCAVVASDGTMWFGTREDGLRHLSADASRSSLVRDVPNTALTSPILLSLAAGQHGDIWAGTPDGLNHVESNGKTTRYTSTDGLPDDLVRSLLVAQDGTLWVGTRGGLAHLHEGRFDTLTAADGLGGNLIGTLFQMPADGDLWIGTLVGLSRLHAGSITNFSQTEGLSSNLITTLATDALGRLWAGSRDQGLFLFEGQRFVNIRPVGLPEEIDGLIADARGSLWLRGRHGILRASATDLARCAIDRNPHCQPTLASYGLEDGVPSEELVANGEPLIAETRTGELWFATRKGVAITDPAAIVRNSLPPPVVIQSFTADAHEIPLDAATTIPSGHTRYTFEFAGLSFTAPSKVLYRYRLEGLDHNWSPETTRRSATYTNLPPGKFTFRVQAANNDGVWNDAGATVAFRIQPPVYRRWWFVLAVLLLLVLLAAALYRLRLRRLQRGFDAVLAERNRIAREIHDTLAQDFVGVSLQLDLVSHLLAQQSVPEAAQQVKQTRSFVQSGIEQARQSIWNLRANTAASSLPARASTLAQSFASATLAVPIKVGGAYRPLPPELEQEVLRVLQEALQNVQRHAGATAAQVHLSYGSDTLILTVQDDGRGISPASAGVAEGHYGLQGMHERAAAIGATLEISGEANQGTTLRLVVPIAERRGVRA